MSNTLIALKKQMEVSKVLELEGLVAVSGGCSLVAVLRLLTQMASLVAERRL